MSVSTKIGIGKHLRLAHIAFSRALRIELVKCEVTFGQFVHLEQLWNEDGLTQTELSRRVGVETASSTAILGQLQMQGLIDRRRDGGDRRKINVHLTAKGAALRQVAYAAAVKVNQVVRRELSPTEVTCLIGLLDRLTNILGREYPGSTSADTKARLAS